MGTKWKHGIKADPNPDLPDLHRQQGLPKKNQNQNKKVLTNLNHGAESVKGQVLGQGQEVAGSAVDQNIETAIVGNVLVHRILHLFGVTDIGGHGIELATGRRAHLLGSDLQLGEAR